MKTVHTAVVTMAVCIGLTGGTWEGSAAEPQTTVPQPKGIEGTWQGSLKVAGTELRLVVKIRKKPDGSLEGTMDSLDQGAKDLPINQGTFSDGVLRFEMKVIGGSFQGKANADITEVGGEWTQSGMTLPLTLKKDAKIPEMRRPQEPKKPYPYDEVEVSYENKQEAAKLAGTLALPRSGLPVPAVLLISGSGLQDRNETVFEHRPFLVLADYLTRRGIAVLRVDDRGIGGSTGNVSEATSEDLAGDVLAGLGYLKSRKEINPRHIGLIGHSEGGLIAPMVAARSTDVSFVVLMAGSGVTGEELLYQQAALIAKASGAPDTAIAENRELQQRLFAVLKQEVDKESAAKQLQVILSEAAAKLTEDEKRAQGDLAAAIETQSKRMLAPWFRFFLTYDPRPTLQKIKVPVLAINGELDLQVPPKQNLPAIRQALKAGDNKDFTITEVPGVNHLFQTAQTGSPAEYARIEETLSPVALKLIGDWIVQHTKEG